jgi:hypothetical protein
MAEHAGKGESGARTVPLWLYLTWKIWDLATWPRTVREMKRAGFRHTGFMTWETGPDDYPPACYQTGLGFWIHGPGCTCPEGR